MLEHTTLQMTERSKPGNPLARFAFQFVTVSCLLLAQSAPAAIDIFKKIQKPEEPVMTESSKTIWNLLENLIAAPDWATARLESILGVTLEPYDLPSNTTTRFFRSSSTKFAGSPQLQQAQLRLHPTRASTGLLILQLAGRCIGLPEVRDHYASLQITDAPRGRSLDEQTVYTASQPLGTLSFGFTVLQPDCVYEIVLSRP